MKYFYTVIMFMLLTTNSNATLVWPVGHSSDYVPITSKEKLDVCKMGYVATSLTQKFKSDSKQVLFNAFPEIKELYYFDPFFKFHIEDNLRHQQTVLLNTFLNSCMKYIDTQTNQTKYKYFIAYFEA